MLRTGTKVAVSIAPSDARELLELRSEALSLGADMVEVRLDAMEDPGSAAEALRSLGAGCGSTILTYRSASEGGFGGELDARVAGLLSSLRASCPGSLVDVELSKVRELGEARELASGGPSIISRHYGRRVDLEEAEADYAEASSMGLYVKLVFPSSDPIDNLLPISLYSRLGPERLVAFCSGPAGLISRLVAAIVGSPIAYASLPGRPVAPGQPPVTEFASLAGAISELAMRFGINLKSGARRPRPGV